MTPITRWRHSPDYVKGIMWRKRLIKRVVQDSGLHAALDAAWWPNRQIELTRHVIAAPIEHPIRLALVADLHVLRSGERERRVIELVERERPDAIAVNGDFGVYGAAAEACGPVLERLVAPLGTWATLGNWDYGQPVPDWRAFLAAHGVRLLTNQSTKLAEGLWLAGLDSALVGFPDLDEALATVPSGAFVAALIHCPVLLEDIAGRVPLALAGHTHGGQVRFLGLRPLYMPRGCWPYVSGWYSLGGTRMYVSRGIGCSSIPVRIGCRPEVAIFEFVPSASLG